jgi:hypothetical protein
VRVNQANRHLSENPLGAKGEAFDLVQSLLQMAEPWT